MRIIQKERLESLRRRIHEGRHPQPLVVEESEAHTCLNCGTSFRGKYCPACGQDGNTGRLKLKHGLENVMDVFASTERGFFHTLLELLIRPGFMMRDYIMGHRKEYVRPIQLLFLLSTVNLLVHYAFYQHNEQFADFLTDKEGNPLHLEGFYGVLMEGARSLLSNYGVVELLCVAVFVLPMWLAFHFTEKQRRTSLVEFFYVMVYVGCLQTIFSIVGIPIDYFSGNEHSSSLMVSAVLMIWAFHQYYQLSVRRAILLYLLGLIYTLVLVCLVAFVVVFMIFLLKGHV